MKRRKRELKNTEKYLSVYEKSMPNGLNLREKAEIARKAGFDGIEISVDESDAKLSRVLDKTVRKAVLREIRTARVPVRTMCLSGLRRFPFGSHDPDIRAMSAGIIRRAIDFSAECGIRIVQIPGYDVWYEKRDRETAKYFLSGLNEAVLYASAAGVTVGIETMEDEFMNTISKVMKYVKKISSPYLQVYPDTGNVRNGTDDYITDLKSGKGHIAALHLKDTKEGIFRDLEIGQGRVDFAGCIREALSQGVRMFNCEIWCDGKSDPLDYLTRNRKRIGEYFAEAEKE